ncbi:MAG: hypothetical protein WC730_02470 [Patescibacteria group bacterium]
MKIWLVEEYDSLRKVLGRVFEDHGNQFRGLETPGELLELLGSSQERPDLIYCKAGERQLLGHRWHVDAVGLFDELARLYAWRASGFIIFVASASQEFTTRAHDRNLRVIMIPEMVRKIG